MKTQPHPSDREVLAGLVERVTYQNAENGFCVIRVKARSHRDLVTVVGHAATIAAGEWITASGDWVNDRTHGQQRCYREQAVTAAVPLMPAPGEGICKCRTQCRRGPTGARYHCGLRSLVGKPKASSYSA